MDLREELAFLPGTGTGASAQRRRVVRYLAGLVVVVVAYTVVYMVLMAVLEGEPVSFTKALLAVVESFTTTGYGEDAQQWTTPGTQLFAVLVQATGVSLIFLALPVFLAPWIEERFSTTAPTSVEDLSAHVVIAGYSPRAEALIDELAPREIPYVVIEPDREAAADLHETGTTVIHGDPESEGALADAHTATARAVVADVDDETNAAIALTADGVCDSSTPVVTLADDDDVVEYHRLAGADRVFTPRRLIGESLAGKVTAGLSPEVDEGIEIAEGFDVVEFPVQSGCEIAGRTVAESNVRERTGANVIGAWFRGEFVSPPSPDAYIDEHTILLVAGHEDQLERLKALTLSEQRRRRRGRVVVGGYGMVGAIVREAIEDADIPVATVDRDDRPGVDVVGDVTEEDTLIEAGLEEASTLILALGNDTLTIFATLVARELAPDVEIVARAEATESVGKVYRAGADYVLSLATVSGRMLASSILDEEVLSIDKQVEVIRTAAGGLAGSSLEEADVRARTGVTVVAVERGGSVVTDLDPSFGIEPGDDLVVAGTDEDIAAFTRMIETG